MVGQRLDETAVLPLTAQPGNARQPPHLPVYKLKNRYFGANMFRLFCVVALMLTASSEIATAGYLDENPDEVFEGVYERIGALPV